MSNCTIVIFGATGDLAKRKLLPDLYRLIKKKSLTDFAIIGAAFSDTTVDQMLERAREHVTDFDEDTWQILKKNTYYHKLDFTSAADFKKLESLIAQIEKQRNFQGNRLLYCATAAQYFCPITQHMAATGVAQRHGEKEKGVASHCVRKTIWLEWCISA